MEISLSFGASCIDADKSYKAIMMREQHLSSREVNLSLLIPNAGSQWEEGDL